MHRLLRHQIVRFVIVGTINTGAAYAAYATLLYAGLPYAAASLGALVLGLLFSFRTQGALVFGNRDGRLFFRFAACWGAIYLLNTVLIGSLIRLGLDAYSAGALAIVPVTVFSYLTQKFLVFNVTGPPRANDS
jgi:putative flippase GtrA